MKTIGFILGIMLLALGMAAQASAKPQLIFQTGECDDGATWWSVSEWDNGQLVQLWGKDCNGNYSHKPVSGLWDRVLYDPTLGHAPVLTGECEATTWRAVLIYDAGKRVVGAGGRFCDETFWATSFDYATGTGWEDAPPVPGVQ